MNIQTQCCGLILLSVLFQFYSRYKRIHLNTERAFGRAFLVTFLSITLDILSIVAITYMDVLPLWLVTLICKTYLVSLVGTALCSLLYIYADVYTKDSKYTRMVRWYTAYAGIGMVLIYMLPIGVHIERSKSIIFTYGARVNVTYVFSVSIFLLNIYFIIHKRNHINPQRRDAVLVWMGFWILAAGVQFFKNSILIVGFASAIGIMILYLKLENPQMNLDRRTGLFNQSALTEYLDRMSEKNQMSGVLNLYFERGYQHHMQTDTGEIVSLEVCRYLSGIPGTTSFKIAEGEIVLLIHDTEDAQTIMAGIRERFGKAWDKEGSAILHPHGIYVPRLDMLEDIKDVFYLFRYARERNKENWDNDFLMTDDTLIRAMYREKEMEQMILDAMENDRIEVFYQPIFSTRENRFVSAEALVRMRDEDGRMIPPGEFIEIAERNGMIIRLGEIVFENVCRFIRENDIIQYGVEYIEVNLSVVQCAYTNLAADYIRIMERYEILPKYINLEITESASLGAKGILLDNMKCLINYGVEFSLDDFGTGQSNLNYIVDMPVEIVKFDRDMTNAYFENKKAKYVMSAAMHMIHGMNLEIVSEGIETEEQFESMRNLGIQYIQGFYFSRPLPETEYLEFIKRNNTAS
ncbi:MAG: EAL domain-containing protein [Lachnospiraceae bacterium]|nr:EAL domain-containing protein [Lachnospiraceae bacterium]